MKLIWHRWLQQFNSQVKCCLQGFVMFFNLNDERHFPYSHLLMDLRVFVNKVLQRIQNMLSLAKCSWYPWYPRTYQALGVKLKVQRAWQELPDSVASTWTKVLRKAPGCRSSVAAGVTLLPQPTLVPGQSSSGLRCAQASKPPHLPPAHFYPHVPQGKARAAEAFAFQSSPLCTAPWKLVSWLWSQGCLSCFRDHSLLLSKHFTQFVFF